MEFWIALGGCLVCIIFTFVMIVATYMTGDVAFAVLAFPSSIAALGAFEIMIFEDCR